MASLESSTGGTTKMTKDDSGVWSFTSPPLEATTHLYFFTVDGVTMADPVNPKIKLRVRTSGSLVEVPGDPKPDSQVQMVPHGSVDWNWQHSAVYNDTHEFMVYLPPGYEKGNTRYPVLYLVHGAGDTHVSWTMAGNANTIMDNLIAQKKAVPMIVVMPFNGGTPAVQPVQGGNLAFEDYMLKELMPFVDAKYRTAPGRKNRAMAGLSAGGAATYNIGFKHLEVFSQFGLFSAAGGVDTFATKYPALAADAKKTNSQIEVLWIGVGLQDTLDKNSKDLDAVLTKSQIKATPSMGRAKCGHASGRSGSGVWTSSHPCSLTATPKKTS